MDELCNFITFCLFRDVGVRCFDSKNPKLTGKKQTCNRKMFTYL